MPRAASLRRQAGGPRAAAGGGAFVGQWGPSGSIILSIGNQYNLYKVLLIYPINKYLIFDIEYLILYDKY